MQDQEDDIRAVAAEALLPVAAEVATRDPAASNQLKSRLWDILLVLEDLDLSTGLFDFSSKIEGACKFSTDLLASLDLWDKAVATHTWCAVMSKLMQ